MRHAQKQFDEFGRLLVEGRKENTNDYTTNYQFGS